VVFNSQKNGGCNVARAFSKTLRAQRARCLPFQIGCAICLPLLGARNLPEELELSQKALFLRLLKEILKAALTERRIKRIYSKPKTVAFAGKAA
jgi:hypothetical protein